MSGFAGPCGTSLAEAEAASNELRDRTNQQVAARLEEARNESDELIARSREECRAMVEEAQGLRAAPGRAMRWGLWGLAPVPAVTHPALRGPGVVRRTTMAALQREGGFAHGAPPTAIGSD